MISARMRRMADCRGDRTHRCRCSIRKSTPCSFSVIGYGSDSGTRWITWISSTSSSKPPGARLSARTLPVTMTEDSCVSPLSASKTFRRHALHVGHALHRAGAIAKDRKQQLARFAGVVEPSVNNDGLAFEFAQGRNRGNGRGGLRRFSCVTAGAVSSGMSSTLLGAPSIRAFEGWEITRPRLSRKASGTGPSRITRASPRRE